MAVITANKKKLHDQLTLKELDEFSNQKPSNYSLVTEIHACFNFISSISSTADLYCKLTILSLVCNSISEVPQLDFCPNLVELNLNNNVITQLKHLEKVPHLQTLSLSCNRVVVLENLSGNNSLKILILSSNRINEISFPTLPKIFSDLTQLGLLDNQIASFSPLAELLTISPNLTQFSIGLNPLTEYNLISTSYLLTNLRIVRSTLFTPQIAGKQDLSEKERLLRTRQCILDICTKLDYLDHSPVSSY